MIELDRTRPVLDSDEVCNPSEPLVIYDVLFSSVDLGAGYNSFTSADHSPGIKFMVVKGDRHSLTVRYSDASPPTTERYNKPADGGLEFCVRVRMPSGLKLQRRPHVEAVADTGKYGRILTCTTD